MKIQGVKFPSFEIKIGFNQDINSIIIGRSDQLLKQLISEGVTLILGDEDHLVEEFYSLTSSSALIA